MPVRYLADTDGRTRIGILVKDRRIEIAELRLLRVMLLQQTAIQLVNYFALAKILTGQISRAEDSPAKIAYLNGNFAELPSLIKRTVVSVICTQQHTSTTRNRTEKNHIITIYFHSTSAFSTQISPPAL